MAGFLTAFLGGALGPGLGDALRRQDQLDAEMRAEERRRKEREEARIWRAEELAAQRDLQRELQDERLAARGGAGTAGTGTAGARGALAAVGAEDEAAYSLMRKRGLDMATARRYVEASKAGENPIESQVQEAQQIDDGDRMRTVTTSRGVPDTEAWLAINREIGQSLMDAPSRQRSNFDQLTQGEGNRQTQGYIEDFRKSGDPRAAQAATLGNKDSLFTNDGTSTTTGLPARGSLASAKIGAEGALANKRMADAGRARSGGGKVDTKGMSDEKLSTQLGVVNRRIDSLSKSMDPADKEALGDAKELAAELTAEMSRRLREGKNPGAAPGAAPTAPKPGAGPKVAPPDVLSKARDAIAKGAPREAVIQRLRSAGYEPAGL